MEFRTVVAAIAPKDDLAKAVILAAKNLTHYDGSLLIVSGWPPLSAGAPLAADMGAMTAPLSTDVLTAEADARRHAETSLRKLAAELAPKATVAFEDGDPADVVAEAAKKAGADIIVTGSHQKGFWGSLVAGGPSRDVVREAPCGVFLVTKPFAEKILADT